jgi:hypothetical protein
LKPAAGEDKNTVQVRSMATDADDPWDAIADGLDDLERLIDEHEDRLPEGVKKKTIRRLRRAIDEARAAADDVEDEKRE